MSEQEQAQEAAPAAPAAPVGDDNLKNVLSLLLDGAMVVKQAAADGKISLSDLPLLMKLAPDLMPAVMSLSKAPAELEALNEAEAADLAVFIAGKLMLADDKAKSVLNASMKLLVGLIGLAEALK